MILPYIEQRPLYDQFNFKVADERLGRLPRREQDGGRDDRRGFICPSDPKGSEPLLTSRDRHRSTTRTQAMGLWYMGWHGPDAHGPSTCPYCPATAEHAVAVGSSTNWCCQGYELGSQAGGSIRASGTFAGIFGAYPKSIAFRDILDGLSNTLMLGETLPGHCSCNSAYSPDFTETSTNIPINTMEDQSKTRASAWRRPAASRAGTPAGPTSPWATAASTSSPRPSTSSCCIRIYLGIAATA